MPETMSFLVPPEADGERLDKWLSGQDSLGLTRSSLQNRMEHGDVTVNGRIVSKNYRQKAGDTVLVTLPGARIAGTSAGKHSAGHCV